MLLALQLRRLREGRTLRQKKTRVTFVWAGIQVSDCRCQTDWKLTTVVFATNNVDIGCIPVVQYVPFVVVFHISSLSIDEEAFARDLVKNHCVHWVNRRHTTSMVPDSILHRAMQTIARCYNSFISLTIRRLFTILSLITG